MAWSVLWIIKNQNRDKYTIINTIKIIHKFRNAMSYYYLKIVIENSPHLYAFYLVNNVYMYIFINTNLCAEIGIRVSEFQKKVENTFYLLFFIWIGGYT